MNTVRLWMSKKNVENKFRDLAPSQNAEGILEYSEAIDFALASPHIKNIAITGPYGSGKSSIIRTYEEINKANIHKFLNISLATFKDEEFEEKSTGEINRQSEAKNQEQTEQRHRLVEQSILQQMLYGADSQKLPYSRFRRIAKPTKPYIKAISATFWGSLLFLLSKNTTTILSFDFSKKWWIWSSISLFFALLSILIIAEIYKILFKTPIKKVSLPKGEFETADLPEDSILNKHLDEIIYFFQETNYNVVVIEDFDRFESPEIFIKLREINKLINDNLTGCSSNKKPSRSVKFLYALKDDMFLHKDRVKFFDFIIPVVPVINSSNSLDKIEERIKGQAYEDYFREDSNRLFLREVSFRLDDLRLIHNIFNEFNIYYSKLKSENLNITKLLAMIIYKNVYPCDFEALHFNKGALASLCDMKNRLLAARKKILQDEIAELRLQLQYAEQEMTRSLQELIDAYVGRIVSYSTVPVIGILAKESILHFRTIKTVEQFEALRLEQNIHLVKDQNYNSGYNRNQYLQAINKSFQAIEEEINPGMTFEERVKAIENRPATEQLILKKAIKKLEQEIATLPLQPLNKLIIANEIVLSESLKKLSPFDTSIFIYLVKNGYLDDSYHLYTSNFYEGRLSSRDREFIIVASNLAGSLPPEFQIDTPQEIIQNIGEEHLNSPYILNVKLIDYLVSLSSSKTKSALSFIADHYSETETFLHSYFASGQEVALFIRKLFSEHPNLIVNVCGSSLSAEIVSYILRFVEENFIVDNLNEDNVLTRYLSENGEKVFVAQAVRPDNYDVLKSLGVKFIDLPALENNSDLLVYCYENGLYSICINNILLLLNHFVDRLKYPALDIKKANYSSIISSQENFLKQYIQQNIETYITDVFLQLEENREETEEAIIDLLKSSSLELKLKEQILSSQEHIFKSLESIPDDLWSHALSVESVEIVWENIGVYTDLENWDRALITGILEDEKNIIILTKNSLSDAKLSDEKKKELFQFAAENDNLKDATYEKYMNSMRYQYSSFPDVSIEKMKILVKTGCAKLTSETFTSAAESTDLRVLLIENNWSAYLSSKDEYPLDDVIREELLNSRLSIKEKHEIIADITTSTIATNNKLAQSISDILFQIEGDITSLDSLVIISAIKNASDSETAISLLIKAMPSLDEKTCMEILSGMDEPYNEIASYGKRPKLKKSTLNLRLTELLDKTNWISSFTHDDDSIQINTFKSADHSEGT